VLAAGTLVDRYELVAPVGEGGMAHVWVARQKGKHGFEKLFAFKCIHPRFADNPLFRSMFLDEARIAASIEHPNVAQVFDLGESDSLLYLVMEYVDGESLGALMTAASRRVNESVVVPTGTALRIIADTCAGLHAAHGLKDAKGNTRGVVHRDVSPQNILVSVRGEVKVIDFGIAVAKDRIGGDTDAGALKGKLHYMAPEQAVREPLGAYTDVFGVGATLYRMLAGHPPFDAGNDAATLHRLIGGAPHDPLPSTVPPLVAAIVDRALDRDPGNRYQSARAMQTAIEAAIMEEGYVTDVATWVNANLSDAAHERRNQLATRTLNIAPAEAPMAVEQPSFVAELGPVPDRARAVAPPPAESRPRAPAPAPAAAMATPALARPAPPPPAPAPPEAAHDPEKSRGTGGPGMLDVRALVARASSPNFPPPAERRQDGEQEPESAPLSERSAILQNAAPAREYVGPATKPVDTAGMRGAGWMKLAGIVTGIVIVLVVVLLLLPRIVRDRILASAREAGIELTIERVGVGVGGISLRGVTAKVQRIPNADFRADEIYASGFSARDVRVLGLDVKLAGPASEVVPALLAFYDANRGRLAGTASDPRRVSIVAAHVTWSGVLGEGTRIDAGELGTDVESRGGGTEDIRANVARFDLTTSRTTFGPWASTFERNGSTSRLRLLLDPPVPDGPNALFVWGKSSPAHVTVHIPRSPIARLGVRPEELGLAADPGTEVEVKLEGGQSPSMRVEGSGRADLFGLRLKGLKSPVDMKIEGAASGLPGRPLELEKATVTLGPFVANVTGSVAATDLGFRLDATWRTAPISCEKLARAEAKSMGPIAAAIQDIARATGAARVTGTAQGSGVVKYDTRTPDQGSLTFMTREACGLSIFGL
jgi:tRNA A-37 threonylcarbamoyl transferase component Bud32